MRKFAIVLGLLTIILMLPVRAFADDPSFRIVGVDASLYPIITAEFKATDPDGNNIRSFTIPDDFELFDGGEIREILNYNCPPGISKFSLILVIDKSQSMVNNRMEDGRTRMENAMGAARTWINALDPTRSECAILAFNYGDYKNPELVHTFSTDKKDLTDSLNFIAPRGGTDYNAAFLGTKDFPGAMHLASIAKYKPIIVFISDGKHNAPSPPENANFHGAEVQAAADEYNVTIYNILLGLSDIARESASVKDLLGLAVQTGGETFEDLKTQQEIERVYNTILSKIDPDEYPAPCILTWETGCEGGFIDVTLSQATSTLSSTFTYDIPDSLKPFLEIDPDPEYINSEPYEDIVVRVTARNNYVDFDGYQSSDPNFTIVGNLTGRLEKDQSRDIVVRYTPTDSVCHESDFELLGSACDGRVFNPSGGFVFHKDVDVGSHLIDTRNDITVTQTFCNWTCRPIKVEGVNITGADAGMFEHRNGLEKATIVQPMSCIDVEYRFEPTSVGQKFAQIEVMVRGKAYTANLTGTCYGNSDIQVTSQLAYENLNCQVSQRDLDVEIMNPGDIDLNVSSIIKAGPDEADFQFVGGNPAPMVVGPKATETFTVRFMGTTRGVKNATLTINSDAEGTPSVDVPLTGEVDEVEISASVPEIDFGVICPDEVKSMTLQLTNDGTMDAGVTGAPAGPFTLPTANYTISEGGSQDVTIEFSSPTEGDFDQVMTFTDDFCNQETTVRLIGKVAAPALDNVSLTITTTFGSSEQGTVNITNNSDRDLDIGDISNLVPGDAQFTVISASSLIIPAGGSIDVLIEYTPTSTNTITTTLTVSGTPCDFEDASSVTLVGNPGQAVAEVFVDDYSGIAGSVVPITIRLINKISVQASGETIVNTMLNYDPLLLEPIGYTNSGSLQLDGLGITGGDNDQDLITINFNVLPGSGLTQTQLDINSSVSGSGAVTLTETDGLFTLMPSTATIEISKDLEARSGQVFDLTFYISGATNLSTSVNQGITTSLSFDATLMEPVGETPFGVVDGNGIRTIEITDLPVDETGGDLVPLKSYQFRALLGRVPTTDIMVENTAVKNGDVNFTEIPGRFTLLGICQSGGVDRLFDPYGAAQIMAVTPNPTESDAEVLYNILERAPSKLILTDMLGGRVCELVNKTMEPGVHTALINTSNLQSGTYLLILKTPTKTDTRRISIVR